MNTDCPPPDDPNHEICMNEVMGTLELMQIKPFNPETYDLIQYVAERSTTAAVLADTIMVSYSAIRILVTAFPLPIL